MQITREDLPEGSDDEGTGSLPVVETASADVMSRRKIAMPRRKMAFAGNTSGAAKAESSFANAFNFAKKTTTNDVDETPAKIKALNIQFSKKITECIEKDAFVDLSVTFDKYKEYMSSITKKNIISTPAIATPVPASTLPVSAAKPLPPINVPAPKVAAPVATNDSSSSSDDEDAETKIEGPAFTLASKPITGDSVFSFGKKKAEKPKDDSDSESDIEIKGPAFTFSGAVKSDVFKFNGKTAEVTAKTAPVAVAPSTDNAKPALSFNFGTPAASEKKDSPETAPKPAFSFGAGSTTTPAASAKPSFQFGNAPVVTPTETKAPALFGTSTTKSTESPADTKKPSFTFGAKQDDAPKSAFSFNSGSTTGKEADEPKKPSFVFGAATTPSNNTQDKETAAPVSAFGLGAKTPDDDTKGKESAKPVTFGLSGSTDSAKSAFSFGAKPESTEPTKPSFAFGSKPSFAFGSKPSATDATDRSASKPSFTFGLNKDSETPKPFSAGAATASSSDEPKKPVFAFGAPAGAAAKKDDKPAFNFGVKPSAADDTKETTITENTTEKPTFNFGASTAASTAPSFSFGKPADSNPFTKSASEKSSVPSGGFKFSLPFGQKDNDTPTTPATSATPKVEPTPTAATETTAGEKEETPVNMQNGEEDENAVFTQRAKLMVFNTESKAYDSRGVGEMKVLQKKDDNSKVRLLCRSDGMGNILLNTSIVKSFQYVPLTAENENLVKTPVIDSDGKLTTYIVKFKTKADGRGFVKAIEDCKKALE